MVRPDSPLGANSYWIVVADEFQVIFYAREKKFSPLVELNSLQNPTAREKLENLVSDRSGRSFDSHGQGRHAFTKEKSDPKSQSYAAFAKDIAERIRDGGQRNKFDKLAIIAAPRFLGVLRSALTKAGTDPDLTIDKEVTGRDTTFIQKLLDDQQ